MWEVKSLVPSRVKPITYQTDTCRFLAWRSAVIGWDKDWLAQCQEKVTEGYRVMVSATRFPSEAEYKDTMNAQCHKTVPILV